MIVGITGKRSRLGANGALPAHHGAILGEKIMMRASALSLLLPLIASACAPTRPVDVELTRLARSYCTSEMQVDLCVQEIRRARAWTYWGGRP